MRGSSLSLARRSHRATPHARPSSALPPCSGSTCELHDFVLDHSSQPHRGYIVHRWFLMSTHAVLMAALNHSPIARPSPQCPTPRPRPHRSRVVRSHCGPYSGHRRMARTWLGCCALPRHEQGLARGAPCSHGAEEPALASHRASQHHHRLLSRAGEVATAVASGACGQHGRSPSPKL